MSVSKMTALCSSLSPCKETPSPRCEESLSHYMEIRRISSDQAKASCYIRVVVIHST